MRERVRALRDVELVDPLTVQPDVLLVVAGSAWGLVRQLESFPRTLPATVVVDLALAIGPRVAALHDLPGYITPSLPSDRLLECLRRAARGLPYAQAPFDEEFEYGRSRGALTENEARLLKLANRGLTDAATARELGWSTSKLWRCEQELRNYLDMEQHQPLAGVAVEVGFYRHFPVPGVE